MHERFHNTNPDYYKGMFIKAVASETRKGLGRRSNRGAWAKLLWLSGKSEKWGLGDWLKGLDPDELLLPTVPGCKSLGVPQFRRFRPVGEEEREGKGTGMFPGGPVCWSLELLSL